MGSLTSRFGLRYDLLIFGRHLPQTIELVDQHPGQTSIHDHIAKSRIRKKVRSPWKENLYELARRDNMYCKLSGMVTEADWSSWSNKDLRIYSQITLGNLCTGA